MTTREANLEAIIAGFGWTCASGSRRSMQRTSPRGRVVMRYADWARQRVHAFHKSTPGNRAFTICRDIPEYAWLGSR